jgi:hypothetical protein
MLITEGTPYFADICRSARSPSVSSLDNLSTLSLYASFPRDYHQEYRFFSGRVQPCNVIIE